MPIQTHSANLMLMLTPLRWSVLGCVCAAVLWAQMGPLSRPETPKVLRPPRQQELLMRLRAKGSQIYVCQHIAGDYAWKLKAPDAKLFGESGELAGRHFAGPTWQANDGSSVVGKVAASAPSPDAHSIPWLLITATSNSGTGIMAGVESVQRLETKGGLAPASGCATTTENKQTSIAYHATYYFYGLPREGVLHSR